jgi:hypothetical protein
MHLWMHNNSNLNQFVDQMIDLLNVGQIKELSEKPDHYARAYYRATVKKGIVNIGKQIEVPVLSGKSVSHRNTIDCIIEVTLECEALERVAGYDWDGKNTKSKQFDIYILCEYKPKLEEVSAYLGQIHLYVRRLQDMYGDAYNKPTIIPVLITLDDMTDFDPLFTNDGIHIFRLAWDANKNTVVNLPVPSEPPSPEPEIETQTKLTGE